MCKYTDERVGSRLMSGGKDAWSVTPQGNLLPDKKLSIKKHSPIHKYVRIVEIIMKVTVLFVFFSLEK